MDIYQTNGYESRDDYIACLSQNFGVPLDETYRLAAILGEDQEFVSLPDMLQDLGYWIAIEMED